MDPVKEARRPMRANRLDPYKSCPRPKANLLSPHNRKCRMMSRILLNSAPIKSSFIRVMGPGTARALLEFGEP